MKPKRGTTFRHRRATCDGIDRCVVTSVKCRGHLVYFRFENETKARQCVYISQWDGIADNVQHPKPKPFRVSAQWIMYAHQPGAESGNRSAEELCDLITERDYVLVPVDRVDLVREIISVAELYTNNYGGDRLDQYNSTAAKRVINRAWKWIEEVTTGEQKQ